jgi:hypothetical protein
VNVFHADDGGGRPIVLSSDLIDDSGCHTFSLP